MQDGSANSLRQTDLMDPARARALEVVLGRDSSINAGETLPPFFHQVYFWDVRPRAALGRDGHPRPGGLIPHTGLPRRMWAGGALEFHAPIRAGIPASKTSRCVELVRKRGRSGALAFVTLLHQIRQGGALCVAEHQHLVYREEAGENEPAPEPPVAVTQAQATRTESFDTTTLFRYSALTFNGHRIHYDLDYARRVERYDGLVVHGPLLAQHLMLMAETALGALSGFEFRARAPLLHHEVATLCIAGQELWVEGPGRRLCMTATARPAGQ